MVELEVVEGDRESWFPLLLEADDSEAVVRSYIDDGELLAIRQAGVRVGVALLMREGEQVEIKNLAVVPELRGRGIGGEAIHLIARRSRAAGATSLLVGTADSSSRAVGFYRRAGFRFDSVRVGFFDAYPEPIWEEGVRARDMVMLRMEL